jgi:hypothetical protein
MTKDPAVLCPKVNSSMTTDNSELYQTISLPDGIPMTADQIIANFRAIQAALTQLNSNFPLTQSQIVSTLGYVPAQSPSKPGQFEIGALAYLTSYGTDGNLTDCPPIVGSIYSCSPIIQYSNIPVPGDITGVTIRSNNLCRWYYVWDGVSLDSSFKYPSSSTSLYGSWVFLGGSAGQGMFQRVA